MADSFVPDSFVPDSSAARKPKPLSTGQQATKFFADMAPGLGGFTGSLVGGGAGAVASAPAGGELSIPGAMGGGAAGGLAGAALQRALYGWAGIPMDERLPAAAAHLGLNAGWEGLMGGLGGVTDAAMRRAAPPVMKAAIGNAEPGAEDLLLKNKLRPSMDMYQSVKQAKDAAGAEGTAAAAQAEANGASFPSGFQRLEGAVKRTLSGVSGGNVLSTEDENAIEGALGVLRSKLGPQTTKTPASKVLGPSGQPAIAASKTVTDALPLSPTRLDRIYKTANENLTRLFEARAANRITVPTAEEKAWMAVRDASGQMLDEGVEGFSKSNATYSTLTKAQRYIYAALKRSPNRGVTAAVTAAAAVPGLWGHDPMMALAGIPIGAATHWAQSPAALGALATRLNDPTFRMASQVPLKSAEVLGLRGLLGLGAPGAPADATNR